MTISYAFVVVVALIQVLVVGDVGGVVVLVFSVEIESDVVVVRLVADGLEVCVYTVVAGDITLGRVPPLFSEAPVLTMNVVVPPSVIIIVVMVFQAGMLVVEERLLVDENAPRGFQPVCVEEV